MNHPRHHPLALDAWHLAALGKGLVAYGLMSLVLSAAQAQGVSPPLKTPAAPAAQNSVIEASAQWRALTREQRHILQPLEHQWPQLAPLVRDKWLNVADRFPHLPPTEQDRIKARMSSWSGMSALERGQARVRFQQAQELSAKERRKKWAEYQALPPEKREALMRQGIRQAKPVDLPTHMVGPREAAQLYRSPELQPTRPKHQKSKVVTKRPQGKPTTPVVIAPAVVKAGPGATTRLVTQKPVAPAHQQPGAPRIQKSMPLKNSATNGKDAAPPQR